MCRFFGFKSCTIMVFTILLKQHVWEKSGSQGECRNALGQSDGFLNSKTNISKINISKNYWRYKVDFLHAGTYLVTLQI